MENKNLLIEQLRGSSMENSNFNHPSGDSSLNMQVIEEENEVNAEATPSLVTASPMTISITEAAASVIAT